MKIDINKLVKDHLIDKEILIHQFLHNSSNTHYYSYYRDSDGGIYTTYLGYANYRILGTELCIVDRAIELRVFLEGFNVNIRIDDLIEFKEKKD